MTLPFFSVFDSFVIVYVILKGMDSQQTSQFVHNVNLLQLDNDVLFHIGIKAGDQDLRRLFGDVKVMQLFWFDFFITSFYYK